MALTPHLRPTALQQLRTFLDESGSPLPPWSTSEAVADRLASLLHSRRDDAAFFMRLTPFLEELRQGAARGEAGLAAPDADLLGRATVDSLVVDLQRQLRAAPEGASPSMLRSLLSQGATPILCFALLATVACTQNSSSSTPTGNSDMSGSPAPVQGGAAAAPAAPRENGQPEPTPQTRDAMVEMFKNKTPQEAAAILEQAIAPDAERKAPRNFGSNDKPKYKGVDF